MSTPAAPVDPNDIDVALNELQKLSSEASAKLNWFSRLVGTSFVERIEDIVGPCLDRLVANVSESELSKIIERVKDRRDKLPVTSEIYSEVVGVCKQILTFGAAGFALSLGFADKVIHLPSSIQRLIVVLGIFYLELIATSIIVLLLYLIQARFRYPFLNFARIGNAWPFFYYGSISDEVPRSPLQLAPIKIRGMTLYGADLMRFAKNAVLESPRQQLKMELQQYFLLMSFMGYVHQFSLRLTNIFLYGVTASVVSLLISIGWGFRQ